MKTIIVMAVTLLAGGGQQPPDAQKQLTPKQKQLNAIIKRQVEVSPAHVSQAVREALSDPNPAVRRLGLDTVSARALSTSRDEIAALDALSDQLFGLMTDPDAEVRRAAVMATGNLDFGAGVRGRLRSETLRRHIAHYYREADPAVRAEIVKGLALVQNTDGDLVLLIEKSLEDPASAVRFYGVRGVGRLTPPNAFNALFRAMEDSDLGVRSGAVMAVGRYGDRARARLPHLQMLLQREQHPSMRKVLESVIASLSRGAVK